eukprot:3578667-Rhodomonas_salina.1
MEGSVVKGEVSHWQAEGASCGESEGYFRSRELSEHKKGGDAYRVPSGVGSGRGGWTWRWREGVKLSEKEGCRLEETKGGEDCWAWGWRQSGMQIN